MTLESWSMGIVRPVMEVFPFAWSFFVPFIVITAFSVLNLFIGLLVNTMQTAVEDDAKAEFHKVRDLVELKPTLWMRVFSNCKLSFDYCEVKFWN